MGNSAESDAIIANVVWVTTGVCGCLLNLTLFVVVLVHPTKGFYRLLTLTIACSDFVCALSGALMTTWYEKAENGLICPGYGLLGLYSDWGNKVAWISWVVTFYGELVIITYSFVWRAVLISNSKSVRFFEHKSVLIMLAVVSVALGYCDCTLDCKAKYVNLTPLEVAQAMLPASLAGLHFIVIAACAIFINHSINSGTFSKKTKSSHTKTLVVLSMQAVNPFFLNFLVDLIYEMALIGVPLPDFLISCIPFSALHPILNPLTILAMTSDHRKFILRSLLPNYSSTVNHN